MEPEVLIRALPADALVLGGVLLASTLLALRGGLRFPAALLLAFLALPTLIALSENAVGMQTLPVAEGTRALVLLTLALVGAYKLVEQAYGEEGMPVKAFIASFATTLGSAALWVTTPSLVTIYPLSPEIAAIFAPAYAFWWIVGSLVVLGYLRFSSWL